MSTIKVNTVTKRTGSTLTLGECGATVALACGATQSGFGRTGTVDWCTTAKTSPFTSVSGKGYFVNTTSGAVTVTLPASPSAGDIIAIKDYANTWDTNNVTLCRNGSKINGNCSNATLNTESQSVTLIYVDGTKGWQDIQDSTANVTGASFTSATGGTITNSPCGDYKIHTFTSSGCFAVSSIGNAAGGGDKVSYMVVAGGGGGSGGAGGAGGFREGKDTPIDSYTASPLAAADSGLTITNTTYPITIGAGGPGPGTALAGSNSVFSTITSTGGGAGGGGNPAASPTNNGGAGGSGGGATQGAATPAPDRPAQGGAGNTPPVSPSQGFPGGNSNPGDQTGSAGGGGATAAGGNSTGPAGPGAGGIGGPGGAGATTSINGSPNSFAGGGGGNRYSAPAGTAPAVVSPGGVGGGGDGSYWNGSSDTGATDGTANTGGGAGATAGSGKKNGGSGIVVIRYKFQ